MRAGERATTLLLFPAAVMVLMVLGAIAVDLGIVGSARREMIRVVGTAADDAADRLDLDRLRAGELGVIDFPAARDQILADLAAADLPGDPMGAPTVEPGPDPATVIIAVTRRIPHVFGRAVPGIPESEVVTVRLVGRLVDPAQG